MIYFRDMTGNPDVKWEIVEDASFWSREAGELRAANEGENQFPPISTIDSYGDGREVPTAGHSMEISKLRAVAQRLLMG